MINEGKFKDRRRLYPGQAQAYFGRYLESAFSYVFDVGSRDLLSVLGAFTLGVDPRTATPWLALESDGGSPREERRRFAGGRAAEDCLVGR